MHRPTTAAPLTKARPGVAARNLAARAVPYLPSLVFASILVYVTIYQPYANGPAIRSDGRGYHVWTYALKKWDFRFCEYAALGETQPTDVAGRCVVKWPPGVALFRFPVMVWFVDVNNHTAYSEGEHWVSVLFGAALTLAIYVLGLDILRRLSLDTIETQAVLFGLFFGTALFHYGTYDNSFSHIYSAFGSTVLAWQVSRLSEPARIRAWDPWLTGVAAFFMILFRNTNALIVLFFLALVALAPTGWRNKSHLLFAACAGSSVATAIQLTYNRYASGHFSLISYLNESFVWDRPMMWSVLFSFERGLFTYYPILLLAFGLGLARRPSRMFTSTLLVLVLIYAAIYGYWHTWHLGGGFGHRGFVELVPWFVAPIGLALADIKHRSNRRLALAIGSMTLLVPLPVMLGYWRGSFPFAGADESVYWAHVLGSSGSVFLIAVMVGVFALTEKLDTLANQRSNDASSFWLRLIIPAAIGMLAFAVRVSGVSQNFWMLGDQIRDWSIALGSIQDLPLVGPPTHVGGYTIGPAFYWILWLLRVTFGPWFENLPHSGGIGQAFLQSGVDALLLLAVWRRTRSVWLAVAAVIVIITAPFDLALAAVVWNPVMGSILAKAATALILLDWSRRSLGRTAIIAAIAWSAVHAYTGAIFVALGIFAALLIEDHVPDWQAVWRRGLVIIAVIGALQIPYAMYRLLHPFGGPIMGAVTDSIADVSSGRGRLHLAASAAFYADALTSIQGGPWPAMATAVMLLAGGVIVAIRYRRAPAIAAAILLPQVAAIIGYAIWQRDDLDSYYYLSLMPAAVLTIFLGVAALLPSRPARLVGIALVIGSMITVPARVRLAATMFKLPAYGDLVAGSRAIVKRKIPMRSVDTTTALPPTSDSSFIVRILGGQIDRNAEWRAEILPGGQVMYSR